MRSLLLVLALAGCAAPPRDFTALVRDEAPAVVTIRAGSASAPLDDQLPLAPSLGAGFIVSEDGYIVTNAHLVEDAGRSDIVVALADRREFVARLVGADPLSDIALVKIEARGLRSARLGDGRRLQPGEWVAAIGSPLGLERSVSAGVVSAVGRILPEESYLPFIQTDVAINPGNSGGPLFNVRGEVVGVNSVIYSLTGGFMGVSFAVPIDTAMEVAGELRRRGKVVRGRIGVRMQELSPDLAEALRVPGGGALIVDVLSGGPAQRAGLRSGDVIVEFAGQRIAGHADLMRLVAQTPPGQTQDAAYVREGRGGVTRVTVVEVRGPAVVPAAKVREPLGLVLVPLDAESRRELGLEHGLRVEHAEGPALRAGLQEGDVVLSVNGAEVATARAFHERLASAGGAAYVALLVQRGRARSFVALRLGG